MKQSDYGNKLSFQTVLQEMSTNPVAVIEREELRFATEIERAAALLSNHAEGRLMVMLAGPSSAGKTTTSLLLQQQLMKQGIDTQVVSLDNFYRGRGKAPQLPDGSFDYESVEALDLPRLTVCLQELLQNGYSELPLFDFTIHRPSDKTLPLKISEHAIVIFEGIHALNPLFEQYLPRDKMVKLFVNTLSTFYDGEEKLLTRRDLRLNRRLLRDKRFRGNSFEHTLSMWRQVVRGEELYMFPYIDTVDCLLDTTHAYEPFLFAHELLPSLPTETSEALEDAFLRMRSLLGRFPPLDPSYLPPHSLLREFFGT